MGLKYNPLIFSGFDNSGSGGGSSGANTSLSNLSSVDLNADLQTADVSVGDSNPIAIRTGDNSGTGATGGLQIHTGSPVLGGGPSGELDLYTGSFPGTTGDLTLSTGQVQTGANANSGQISITTGDVGSALATSQSGPITVATGPSGSAISQVTGDILIQTGKINGNSSTSGSLTIRTGQATHTGGVSGDIFIRSGSATATKGEVTLDGRVIHLEAVDHIDANNVPIVNVQDPSAAQDAVTKNYVDNNFAPLFDVAARAHSSTTTISGTLATIVYATEDFDEAGAYNNATGIYTTQVDGKYQVNAGLLFAATIALNNTVIMEIQKNSSVYTRKTIFLPAALTDGKIDISDIVKCTAGDTIRIQVSTNSTSPSIVSSAFDNFLSIAKF